MEKRGNNSCKATSCLLILVIWVVGGINLAKAAMPIFIFGDSTVDVGTNNFLNGTTALANFPYNGVDFPRNIPTGRFSNGYNIADQLAMLLGYESSPQPYLYLVNNASNYTTEILRGVNFASGGSGLLHDTGMKLWNNVVPMEDQIQQFTVVRGNISQLMGEEEAAKIIANSFFVISTGSNDILDSFRLGVNITKDYLMSTLHSAFNQNLKDLYDLGGRKFGIIPAGAVGCCPYMRANQSDGRCVSSANEFARAFYDTVHTLLWNITSELPHIKFSLGNVYKMTKYVLKNYRYIGFNEIKKACCGKGHYNGEGFCSEEEGASLCENRKEYIFWDLYHPSEAATNLSAIALFYGDRNFVRPINFAQLAALQL